MANASANGSIVKILVDNAHELYEKNSRKSSDVAIRLGNIKEKRLYNDAVSPLISQMEVLTKKMDKLAQIVHRVCKPTPVC